METITAILMAITTLFGMADDQSANDGDTCTNPFVRAAIVCENDWPCGQILARLDQGDCWFEVRPARAVPGEPDYVL